MSCFAACIGLDLNDKEDVQYRDRPSVLADRAAPRRQAGVKAGDTGRRTSGIGTVLERRRRAAFRRKSLKAGETVKLTVKCGGRERTDGD